MEKRMLCELMDEFLVWRRKAQTGRHLLHPSRPRGEERHRGSCR